MPREDHRASLGPHAAVLTSISSADDISPHTPIQERQAECEQDGLNTTQYSTAASRLIIESLDQRCWDWVSLASLAAISSNQGE